MNFANLFSKLYPKAWREKTKVNYKFDFDDETWEYSMEIFNLIEKNWWLQLIRKFNETQLGQNKIELKDEFEVTNQRLKDITRKHLKSIIDKIVNDIHKDPKIPKAKNLKLLTCNVDRIVYKTLDARTVKSEIYLSGICSD